jgi:hypothetical protein
MQPKVFTGFVLEDMQVGRNILELYFNPEEIDYACIQQ